jgi:hypothetical protein
MVAAQLLLLSLHCFLNVYDDDALRVESMSSSEPDYPPQLMLNVPRLTVGLGVVCCVFVCVRFFPSLILSASLWHGTASHFVCECACVCVCLLFWAQCCTRGLIFRWRVTVITNNGRVAPSCAVLYLVWGVRD